MKKTYIFMNRFRYDRGSYHRHYNPDLHRFVFLLDEEFYHRFPQEHRDRFDRLVLIEDWTIENIQRAVEEELQLVDDPNDVHLVCWSEGSLLLAAEIRERLGLPGIRSNQLKPFRDKLLMKQKVGEAGIRIPRYTSMSDEEAVKGEAGWQRIVEEIGFPMIAKPVDGAGSSHTAKLENQVEFLKFCQDHIENLTQYDFEEFVLGKFYHCDSFVLNGEIKVSEVCEYTGTGLDFVNGHPLGSRVLPADDVVRNAILEFNRKILNTLNAPDGCTHLEVFVTPKQEIVFIEIAARAAGGEVIPAYIQGIGLDFYDLWMRLELGMEIDITIKKRRATGWMYYPRKTGTVKQINVPSLQCEFETIRHVEVGQVLKPASNCYERMVTIKVADDDFSKVLSDMEYLEKFQMVDIEDLEGAVKI
jgi:hypothetical protein